MTEPIRDTYRWVHALRRKTFLGARNVLQVRGAELVRVPVHELKPEVPPQPQAEVEEEE